MNVISVVAFSIGLLSTSLLADSPTMLLSSAIRLNKIVVSYPAGVISERDLRVCDERSVCNVIHNKFWFPPLVERLCRCPHRNECPWTWSSQEDNQTMYLNNRSQLKFCVELNDLPECTQKKSAVTISTLVTQPAGKDRTCLQSTDRARREGENRNITVSCHCREPHYWKLKSNSTRSDGESTYLHQTYYCSRLKKCARSGFCGHVRVDTHSTYYRCSCPRGHMCMTKNKTIYHADEILYDGEGYKAFCLPAWESSKKS